MASFVLQSFGGSLQSIAQIAGIAGTLVLVLLIVAAGALAFKHLKGDGVEWPGDDADDDGVSRGGTDDEWKYY